MKDKPADVATPLPDPATWVDQHGDYLFRYALSRLGNPEVAEDLVQETFLAALRAAGDFAGKSSERTWFVGIMKHKMVDYFRRQERERPVTALNSAEDSAEELFDHKGWWKVKPAKWSANAGELLERKEFWEIFRRCLAKLPQKLAAAFSLREMDELSSPEICGVLKVTASNLGVLLYRARMGLRRCLEIHWFNTKTKE